MRVGRNWEFALCQNCVTYPPKPWSNTVIYGDRRTLIGVAEIVESKVRLWDFVCVSTRGGSQFPSVLLKPLGHLSVSLESIAYGRMDEPGNPNYVRPPNVLRSLTATRRDALGDAKR